MSDFLKNKTEELICVCKCAEKGGAYITVTGHDMPDHDSIISAIMMKELLSRLGVKASVKFATRPDKVTERDMRAMGLLEGIEFGKFADGELLLLVDHHVTYYNNKVIGCVDHHTTPPEPDFDFSLIIKASSCGRIIFDMAVSLGVSDDWLERLAIYSVYLDTQSCRSPKFDQNDNSWLKDGIDRLKINENELVRMGFCLMSSEESADELAMYGYKRYEYNGKRSASTCIQIDADDAVWGELLPEVVERVRKRCDAEKCALWAFVVNKPIESHSDIYFVSASGVQKIVNLDRLASRSRDVIPIMKVL